MKKFILVIVSLTFVTSFAGAAELHEIKLGRPPLNLLVSESFMDIVVQYPGLTKNSVCSIELKLGHFSTATAADLNEVLQVEEYITTAIVPIQALNSNTALIELQKDLYMTGLSIRSRDGRALRDVLREIGIYDRLLLSGKGCP